MNLHVTMSGGFLLSACCAAVGFGLWYLRRWAWWTETLLVVPKLYGAYLLGWWPYAITQYWVYLFIIGVVIMDAALVFLLWSTAVRVVFKLGVPLR